MRDARSNLKFHSVNSRRKHFDKPHNIIYYVNPLCDVCCWQYQTYPLAHPHRGFIYLFETFSMDLNKISDEEKLSLCKRYFIGGFFALPLLWLVNVVWFFRQSFLRPWFKEQKQMRYFVGGSFVGFFLYTIPIVAWAIYFQQHRVEWGKWGQSISFITPAGQP